MFLNNQLACITTDLAPVHQALQLLRPRLVGRAVVEGAHPDLSNNSHNNNHNNNNNKNYNNANNSVCTSIVIFTVTVIVISFMFMIMIISSSCCCCCRGCTSGPCFMYCIHVMYLFSRFYV